MNKKRRRRRSFTREFKAEVVGLCLRSDRSIGQIARDLDLTESAVRAWMRQSQVDKGEGPPGALTSADKEEIRRLRRGGAAAAGRTKTPKKNGGLLRERKHMRFEFLHAEKASHSVRTLCGMLQVSPSGYYAWRQDRSGTRRNEDAVLAAHIRAIYKLSRRTYGSPRITEQLKREGFAVGRNRVARLMRQEGLEAVPPKRFRGQRGHLEIHRAILQRHEASLAPRLCQSGRVRIRYQAEEGCGSITKPSTESGQRQLEGR